MTTRELVRNVARGALLGTLAGVALLVVAHVDAARSRAAFYRAIHDADHDARAVVAEAIRETRAAAAQRERAGLAGALTAAAHKVTDDVRAAVATRGAAPPPSPEGAAPAAGKAAPAADT